MGSGTPAYQTRCRRGKPRVIVEEKKGEGEVSQMWMRQRLS